MLNSFTNSAPTQTDFVTEEELSEIRGGHC